MWVFFKRQQPLQKNKGKITGRRERNVDVIILQGTVENTAIFFSPPLKNISPKLLINVISVTQWLKINNKSDSSPREFCSAWQPSARSSRFLQRRSLRSVSLKVLTSSRSLLNVQGDTSRLTSSWSQHSTSKSAISSHQNGSSTQSSMDFTDWAGICLDGGIYILQ